MARYQGWTGERKQKCKRGFATKREAAQWEQQFILQKKASMDMELESFCKLCEEDVRPRLKKSTWLTKENIIKSKILPYLGRAYGKGGSYGEPAIIYTVENCIYRGRTGKSPTGVSGHAGNTG